MVLILCGISKHQTNEIIQFGLADEKFDIPGPIDAILAVEMYTKIIGSDLYKHNNRAIMQSSSFGHIILGKFDVLENS